MLFWGAFKKKEITEKVRFLDWILHSKLSKIFTLLVAKFYVLGQNTK
jgi:hypothetical protein